MLKDFSPKICPHKLSSLLDISKGPMSTKNKHSSFCFDNLSINNNLIKISAVSKIDTRLQNPEIFGPSLILSAFFSPLCWQTLYLPYSKL